MVTSPGGTSAAALHELERGRLRTVMSEAVWAAYRRTNELGDQLEAQVDAGDDGRRRRATGGRPAAAAVTEAIDTTDATTSTCGTRRSPTSAASTSAPPTATCGPTRRRSGIGSSGPWPGSTTRPGTCPAPRRRTPAGPDWSLAEHVGHIADWQELAIDYVGGRHGDRPLADRRRLRRRRLRSLQRTSPGALDDDVRRGHRGAPRGRAAATRSQVVSALAPTTSGRTRPGAGCT